VVSYRQNQKSKMMETEIIELNKANYHKGIMAAWGKARQLASKNSGSNGEWKPKDFYSKSTPLSYEKLCVHFKYIWIKYAAYVKSKTYLTHCINIPCIHADPNTVVDCWAKIKDQKNYRYYHCSHLIGQCPHKT
jgi:hypothetical protein